MIPIFLGVPLGVAYFIVHVTIRGLYRAVTR